MIFDKNSGSYLTTGSADFQTETDFTDMSVHVITDGNATVVNSTDDVRGGE